MTDDNATGAAPTRPARLVDVVQQDEFWWPRDRDPMRIADMAVPHMYSVMVLLRGFARSMHMWALMDEFDAALPDDQQSEVYTKIKRMSPDRWLYAQPLMQVLWEQYKTKKNAYAADVRRSARQRASAKKRRGEGQ